MSTALQLVRETTTSRAIEEFERLELELDAAKERIGRSLFERRQALRLSLGAVSRLLHGSSGTASDISKVERGLAPRGLGLARRLDDLFTRLEAERAR
jgi:hypothetical protein